MKNRFIKLFPLALAAAVSAQNAFGQSTDVTINFVQTGEGDWNVASNWLTPPPDNLSVVPGDNFNREVASISNGGTAFLNAPAGFPIDGLLIGDIATGRLEIRAGGSLTPRQREVVTLLAQGRTMKEAAAALGMSPRTVETHKYQVMHEHGLQTTADLVRFALEHGLIQSAPPS